ncbi:MAG: C40 family peptidase [Actinomycetia bacterium]|nr:C40 family peptidase [Actinomycetes bacterium]
MLVNPLRKLITASVAAVAALGFVIGSPVQAAAAVPTTAGTYAWTTAAPEHVAAINAAYSVIGTPYLAGGNTPAGYDCSGLVQWAYGQAGITLPRDSRGQQVMTTNVGAGAARPGDLVFWGSPVYHAAIYVGDGMVIHSPSSGKTVSVVPITWMGTPSSYGRIK